MCCLPSRLQRLLGVGALVLALGGAAQADVGPRREVVKKANIPVGELPKDIGTGEAVGAGALGAFLVPRMDELLMLLGQTRDSDLATKLLSPLKATDAARLRFDDVGIELVVDAKKRIVEVRLTAAYPSPLLDGYRFGQLEKPNTYAISGAGYRVEYDEQHRLNRVVMAMRKTAKPTGKSGPGAATAKSAAKSNH